MSRTVASIIAGRPATDAPGGHETSTNPADTSETVADVLLGDAGTFVAACEAARAAQREWAAVPAPVRGRAIQQLGRLVEDNKEALSRLVTREIGKPYAESLGEVQEIVDTCNFFVGEGRRLYGQTVPVGDVRQAAVHLPQPGRRGGDHHRRQLPGRRALLVPRPGAAVRQRRGLEAGRVRAGDGRGAGPALPARRPARRRPEPRAGRRPADLRRASSRRSSAASSTRSASPARARSAREIGALCGRHLQSPCLELGGKNPLVVMADADLDLAVEGALFSGFGTAGQRCTSLGTVIVDERVHDDFFARLKAAVEGAAIGDPSQDVLYGPMIHERFLRALRERVARAHPRPPQRPRLDRHRAHHGRQPARGLRRRRPGEGPLRAPDARRRRARRRRPRQHRDLRPARRRRLLRRLGGGHGAGQRPRLRPERVDLHDEPAERLPLSRAHRRRHGQRQQLDQRRRGPPALRRQRQVGQRLAPVGHVGASTSSRAGSRSTGTTPASCRRRRWTSPTSTATSTTASRSSARRHCCNVSRYCYNAGAMAEEQLVQLGPGARPRADAREPAGRRALPAPARACCRMLRRARRRAAARPLVELIWQRRARRSSASTATARARPTRARWRPTSATCSARCAPSSRCAPGRRRPRRVGEPRAARARATTCRAALLLASAASPSPSPSASSSPGSCPYPSAASNPELGWRSRVGAAALRRLRRRAGGARALARAPPAAVHEPVARRGRRRDPRAVRARRWRAPASRSCSSRCSGVVSPCSPCPTSTCCTWTMWLPALVAFVLSIRACRDIGQQPWRVRRRRRSPRGSRRGVILEIDPRSAVPPYEQLRQQVTALVLGGALETGDRLPAIRQLANDLGLAGGTVARAYRELESDGVVSDARAPRHGHRRPAARAARRRPTCSPRPAATRARRRGRARASRTRSPRCASPSRPSGRPSSRR